MHPHAHFGGPGIIDGIAQIGSHGHTQPGQKTFQGLEGRGAGLDTVGNDVDGRVRLLNINRKKQLL